MNEAPIDPSRVPRRLDRLWPHWRAPARAAAKDQAAAVAAAARADHRHPPAPRLQRPSRRRPARPPARDRRHDDDSAAGRPGGECAPPLTPAWRTACRRRRSATRPAIVRAGASQRIPLRRQRGPGFRGRDAGDRALSEARRRASSPNRSSAWNATRRRCRRSTQLARAYDVPVLMHWQFKMYNYGFERFHRCSRSSRA